MDVRRIREDFPILDQEVDEKPIVYFDNASMTLMPRKVVEAMSEYNLYYHSIGRQSIHRLAAKVGEKFNDCRRKLQKFINAKYPEEIIFVKNATEGLNLVARGLNLKRGDVVLTTDCERNSNIVPWHILEKTKGIRHEVVQSNEDNRFNFEQFEKQISDKVKLVSMAHISGLDGHIIPVDRIIEKAHEHGSLVMLDCSFSVPSMGIDVWKLNADFIVFSIHRICGPSGVGILYGKRSLLNQLSPLVFGDHAVQKVTFETSTFLKSPEYFEAGVPNYSGIIGAGAAVEYISHIGLEAILEHQLELNELVTKGFNGIPEVKIIGPQDPKKRPSIISFNVGEINSHDIALTLDIAANILVQSGMHCVHSWFNLHGISGSVRASFYIYNTKEEAQSLVDVIKQIIKTT